MNTTPEDVKLFTDFNMLMNELLHDWEKMTDEKRKRRAQKMVVIYMNITSATLARTAKSKVSMFPKIEKLFIKEYKDIDGFYKEADDGQSLQVPS